MPDMTLIFDIDPAEGLRRASARRGSDTADRFEKETLAIHQRRREAYLAIARQSRSAASSSTRPGNLKRSKTVVTAAVFAALEARGEVQSSRIGRQHDLRTHRP